MVSPTLGSILLSSTNPERLGNWYAATLSPERDNTEGGYRILKFGGFYLLVDTRDDIGDTNPEPGRIILNFDVADAQAVATKFDQLGTQWLSKLEDRNGSWFGTAIDPDGNYVQIIQLSEADRAAMAD